MVSERTGAERTGSEQAAKLPLTGIRVVEMGQLIAGPFAGQILAAYGAEVVKIEPPGRGDPLRTWRLLDDEGTSYWWQSIARGKQSLTLDLSQTQGSEIAHNLILEADVVLENFRPGRMESWGLGPDRFAVSHPKLIYTRVSGYGQDGPYSTKPGFASACEAMAGLRYLNGHPDQKPVRMNLSLGDSLAGMHAAMGILLALISRFNSTDAQGGAMGQCVDVSIMESVFNMMEGVLPEFSGEGAVREPSGCTVTGIVPTNTYRCKDGRFIVIGGNGDSIFKRLMNVIGRADLADDHRLANNQGRLNYESMIDEVLEHWCSGINSERALSLLDKADVPVGPVNSIADIAADPQFKARSVFEQVNVNGQPRTVPAMHPKLSASPARDEAGGPLLGEHTEQVLKRWLGVGRDEIQSLRSRHLI